MAKITAKVRVLVVFDAVVNVILNDDRADVMVEHPFGSKTAAILTCEGMDPADEAKKNLVGSIAIDSLAAHVAQSTKDQVNATLGAETTHRVPLALVPGPTEPASA